MRPDRLNRRQVRLWDLFDFSQGSGLEIGPLHNTSIRREHADVRYLDVFDRPRLLENYRHNKTVNTDNIPEIDYALSDGDRVRSIPETIGPSQRFDWVMAAHVIEHVPDVIGWLDQVAEITVDGGRLVLIVPDRRYCFDVHRPGTTVGQLLQAHEQGDTAPSIRAVYDYKRGHAGTKAPDVWDGRPPGYEKRLFTLEQVLAQVDRARAGEYIDGHVWTFTPGTLLEQLLELRALGLSSWRVESHVETRRNESEFFVVLRRLPREQPWSDELFADEPRPREAMPDWLAEWVSLRRELEEARRHARGQRRQLARLEARLTRVQRRRTALERELDDVKASWRWRAGGLVTGPARRARSLVRRRRPGAGA